MNLKPKDTWLFQCTQEEPLIKNWHVFMIKSPREDRDRGIIAQHNKSSTWKNHSQHHSKWRQAQHHPTDVKNEKGMATTPTPFQPCAWCTGWSERARERKQRDRNRKRRHCNPIADYMGVSKNTYKWWTNPAVWQETKSIVQTNHFSVHQ